MKWLLNPIVALVKWLRAESTPAHDTALPVMQRNTAVSLIESAAIGASALYISNFVHEAMLLNGREPLWEYALRRVSLHGLNLEFGVYRGYSINPFAAELRGRTVFGFDSFSGLHEDWAGTNMPAGTFDLDGSIPRVAKNVVLKRGQFSESLPPFLASHDGDVAFVHFDADTEESTDFVLEAIAPRLVPGSVLVFDEYHSHQLWKTRGEYTAWERLCERRSIAYRYMAFGPRQAALRVLRVSGEGE